MNHPIHPEEQVFGGMVRGRDVPEPAGDSADIAAIHHYIMTGTGWNPASSALKRIEAALLPARTLAIVDAHHAKLMAAMDEKDAEIARLTAAGPVAAQPQGEPVWFHAECDDPDYSGFHLERGDAEAAVSDHGGVVTELCERYTHPIAQPVQPAVPVTDAEVETAMAVATTCGDVIGAGEMRRVLKGFLASRGQA